VQPAGILKYGEDLRRGINADIGRKNFFEIAYDDLPVEIGTVIFPLTDMESDDERRTRFA
jgi:hypothetical protein